MKAILNYEEIDIRLLIILAIAATLIFIILGYYSIQLIENHFYDEMEKKTLRIAESYSYSLKKGADANLLVNQLLVEKLTVISKLISSLEEDYNSQFEELAATLNLDAVYIYNDNAVIVESNHPEYLGWKPRPGHPVYEFWQSDQESRVEDIRPDSETGVLYKYGYFRNPDGSFIQVGIKSSSIDSLLSNFRLVDIINEIESVAEIKRISFINNDFITTHSTDEKLINSQITNPDVINNLKENNRCSAVVEINNEEFYRVITRFDYNNQGYLSLLYPMDETNKMIGIFSKIAFLVLTIVYIIILYSFYLNYQKNKNLVELAYNDKLTKLPNIEYLKEYLTNEVVEDEKTALFLINLNNFNLINLSFGYDYGSQLIRDFALQLKNLENDNKKLFRFDADRFILVYQNYSNDREIIREIKEIQQKLNLIFKKAKFDNQYLSAGIAVEKEINKYKDIDTILSNLNITVDYRKESNKNYVIFNQEMKQKIIRRDDIERELKEAISLEKESLYLEFQPMLDLVSKQIIGFEALARMESDKYGKISPEEFINIAENRHFIMSLTRLIFKKAAVFSAKLESLGFKDLKISVNVSGLDIIQDKFTENILKVIRENGASPNNIKIEITESVLLNNFEIINAKLARLQTAGITVALDDFGTGYSSFHRLTELNLDTIKIDKYFVNMITKKKEENILVTPIINIGHRLGLTVIAEGVELEAEKEYLLENDCDIIQGYFISKPISEKDAINLLLINLVESLPQLT